jgi:ATP-binding cassette subfamily B protein
VPGQVPCWPAARAGEALRGLAHAAGLAVRPEAIGALPAAPPLPAREAWQAPFADFVEDCAAFLGVEAEPLDIRHGEVERLLARSGPALAIVNGSAGDEPRLLAWLGIRRGRLRVMGPEGVAAVPLAAARALLCAAREAGVTREVDALLDGAGVPAAGRRRARLRASLVADRLAHQAVALGFAVAEAPSAPLARAARGLRIVPRVALLLGLHTLRYAAALAGWALLGRAVLAGRLDGRWLLAFLALQALVIPFQLVTTWQGGGLAADVGALVKRRLLVGALRLDPEQVRHRGVGRFLGLVYESSAVEKMGLAGGFTAALAAIELLVSCAVLALGAGGIGHAALLVGWTVLGAALARRYLRRRQAWTERRLSLTYDLVERLAGHRTRLAQEDPAHHHDEEDRALDEYLRESRGLDRAQLALGAVLPWGWLVVGIAGLLAAYVFAPPLAGVAAAGRLATGLGGVLLAQRALTRLAEGLTQIAGAVIAWREVRPLFAAARRAPAVGVPLGDDRGSGAGPAGGAPGAVAGPAAGPPLLEARELTYAYGDRLAPVLRGASLVIGAGDRLLVGGASGGGKSTLASLLAGLRIPASGILRARGLDRATLGANGWRRRVVSAPQLHENHVFSTTLAFNLLLGRRWPPERRDLEEAEAICRELGLGPLVARMPSGLWQMVGETGWQLSHGERSRLFIARALLQGSDLLILDESFAALDPPTLEQAMSCVLERARALMIIAHP